MTTVVLAPTGTASFPDGGGHWWVYLQYALALRDLGCRVLWLERLTDEGNLDRAGAILDRFGVAPDQRLFYRVGTDDDGDGVGAGEAGVGAGEAGGQPRWIGHDGATAERLVARADALLNFDYSAPSGVVGLARRSALIDIDPGLTQTWWSAGLIEPAPHDRWITTGETVGTPAARFSDCGVAWHHIRPPVHLPSWPVIDGPADGAGRRWTTVTSWWGDEWLTGDDGEIIENNKRVGFLPYVGLPNRSGVALELAAYFGRPAPGDDHEGEGAGSDAGGRDDEGRDDGVVRPDNTDGDGDDVRRLLAGGWSLVRSGLVAGDPDRYRHYIQDSRGEFSCVKPSCRLLANAWVSDRTLCYLASGRPAVVEHTGPSEVLDGGEGLLRFASPDEAADALGRVEADYGRHAEAARELVEAHFSAVEIVAHVLDTVLDR